MRKTLSFAGIHFLVAFGVGYLLTGNVWVGGALALVEPACNTVAFRSNSTTAICVGVSGKNASTNPAKASCIKPNSVGSTLPEESTTKATSAPQEGSDDWPSAGDGPAPTMSDANRAAASSTPSRLRAPAPCIDERNEVIE